VRMADPAIDSGGTHVEVAGDLPLRPSPSNGLNYRATAAGLAISLLMVRSSQGGLVSNRPTMGSFSRLWQLTVQEVVAPGR
jgi:hypothetical protein